MGLGHWPGGCWGERPTPPSSALLCHWQSQWVWGPSGYGAILLVNCDKDDLNCNERDNHDQHVRSLQGEGPGAVSLVVQAHCSGTHRDSDPQG